MQVADLLLPNPHCCQIPPFQILHALQVISQVPYVLRSTARLAPGSMPNTGLTGVWSLQPNISYTSVNPAVLQAYRTTIKCWSKSHWCLLQRRARCAASVQLKRSKRPSLCRRSEVVQVFSIPSSWQTCIKTTASKFLSQMLWSCSSVPKPLKSSSSFSTITVVLCSCIVYNLATLLSHNQPKSHVRVESAV